jgi:hypothetical protein
MILTMPYTPWRTSPNIYPKTRRSEHVDEHQSATRGKVLVPNPLHWMGKDTPEVKEELSDFIDAQNDLVQEFLSKNPNLLRLERAMYDSNMYPKVRTVRYCSITSPSTPNAIWSALCTGAVPRRKMVLVL